MEKVDKLEEKFEKYWRENQRDHEQLREDIIQIRSDLKLITKLLKGNGVKGLAEQVQENTSWRWKLIGAMALLTFLLMAGMITLSPLISMR